MICPFCKNEKLKKGVCPSCGLDEEQALLEAARERQREGKWAQAREYYGRYLQRRPRDLEAGRQSAFCSWKEAVHMGTFESREKAERDLAQTLAEDWDWEAGHEYRIQLSGLRGDLAGLKDEYHRIVQTDGNRRPIAERILRVLELTEKFQRELPAAATSLPEETDWRTLFKVFAPLLTGLLLSVVVSSAFFGEERSSGAAYKFLSVILLLDFILFVLSFYLYRKVRLRGGKREHEKNISSLGPPDLPRRD